MVLDGGGGGYRRRRRLLSLALAFAFALALAGASFKLSREKRVPLLLQPYNGSRAGPIDQHSIADEGADGSVFKVTVFHQLQDQRIVVVRRIVGIEGLLDVVRAKLDREVFSSFGGAAQGV